MEPGLHYPPLLSSPSRCFFLSAWISACCRTCHASQPQQAWQSRRTNGLPLWAPVTAVAGNRCAHALVSLSFSECFSGNVELLSIFRNFIWHPNQCLEIYIGSKMLCLVNQGSWPLPRPRSINLQGGDAVFFTLSTYSVLRKLLFYTKLYFGVNSNFLITRPIPYPGKGAASGPPSSAHALHWVL